MLKLSELLLNHKGKKEEMKLKQCCSVSTPLSSQSTRAIKESSNDLKIESVLDSDFEKYFVKNWSMSCLPCFFQTNPALAYFMPFSRVSLKAAW